MSMALSSFTCTNVQVISYIYNLTKTLLNSRVFEYRYKEPVAAMAKFAMQGRNSSAVAGGGYKQAFNS